MKKLILPLLAAGLFAAPSLASAASNPYVSISGGAGLMSKSNFDTAPDYFDWKTGYNITGAFGLKSDMFRLEGAVGYQHNGMDNIYGSPVPDSWNVSMWTFMANGYYDFKVNDSSISPYVMGGLGLASVTLDWDVASETDSVFAWQLGAGVGIKAGDKMTVDIGYRYLKPADPTWLGNKYSLASNNIQIGLRFDL